MNREEYKCAMKTAGFLLGERAAPAAPWWLRYRVDLAPGRRGPWEILHQRIGSYHPPQTRARSIEESGRPMPPIWPGTVTALQHYGPAGETVIWMSDAPNEILEQLHAIKQLRGRVLLGGLGLGVMIRAALLNPAVESIEVLEIDPDIIALIGPAYADPRVTIFRGDVLAFDPGSLRSGGSWDVVWMDIWPTITAKNIPGMLLLRQKFGGRCGWYGAWGEAWCVRKVQEAVPAAWEGAGRRIRRAFRCRRPRARLLTARQEKGTADVQKHFSLGAAP